MTRKFSVLRPSESAAIASEVSPGVAPYLDQIQEFDKFDDPQEELMHTALYEYMADIRERVMKEFELDHAKWSDILSQYVEKAIQTVRPWSYKCSDSIDITKYVKI
jgi:hypothetical protein